jgi:hypothetical protein
MAPPANIVAEPNRSMFSQPPQETNPYLSGSAIKVADYRQPERSNRFYYGALSFLIGRQRLDRISTKTVSAGLWKSTDIADRYLRKGGQHDEVGVRIR